ncbi:DUF2784 domain-containing protein [Ningiella sp. W23]|uniref:DUF2784 domain-containing protein n=1 Tax=Ningiella sp. W23 TaxID=3023715 RepID=UPI003757DACB
MDEKLLYLIVADLLLFVHVLFVGFIVFGLLLIFIGKMLTWQWVYSLWFRLTHLIGISIVVIQAWLGIICPLTTWEMTLRDLAGDTVYEGSFISYWLSSLLYYTAPAWVFAAVYTVFGILVVLSWFWVRPRKLR